MRLTKTFLSDIRELIVSARATVARGVDLVQVHTNFEIGRRIVEPEQKGKDRADYGEQIVKALAERLTAEFGRGFSERNLAYMRTFYLLYQDRGPILQSAIAKSDPAAKSQLSTGKLSRPKKSQSMIGQFETSEKTHHDGRETPVRFAIFQPMTGKSAHGRLKAPLTDAPPVPEKNPAGTFDGRSRTLPFTLSWIHYLFLFDIKNPDERRFYEIEAAAQNWTVREPKRQFDSSLYERLAHSRDKEGIRRLASEGQIVSHVNDLLKEPLVLEFLGLDERTHYSETDLETAIINQVEHFLLEFGKGFLFESRQRRFTFDGDHFFVDLVFYNRLLRCYVLIDLKLGKLTHQDLGQMQMYVNYFDREVKTDDENSTIGIILCKQRNAAVVKITLPKNANIHAREYQLYLPSEEVLQRKLMEWAEGRGGTAP